ncbi:enoyl-CoA hydratase-related protein [Benzoatithermus flavus]|uniref:Enoyl-CoA hydratase-related protein n=1 Tax=Benzoatithermus flavus TaxID=3108223 RepID=A0ABU8XQ12_9PROT
MSQDTPVVRVDRDGPLARVTLNRPEIHNAFDERLIEALAETFRHLAEDGTARAVLLAGAGKSFSAGADLNWMKRAAAYDEEQNRADARALELMLRRIDECPKPVIALVQGAAIGGGLGLVAACDIAIAGEAAQFATSEVRLGIVPAVISPFVVRAIGPRQARRWFLTAERFGAEEARRIGLVHEVVPTEHLEARGREIVAEIVKGGPEAIAEAKRLVRLVETMPQGGSILAEATVAMIAERRASPEGKEGIGAFLEKRKPAWIAGAEQA